MTRDAIPRMLDALTGLNVGDAFGEAFFVSPAIVGSLIAQRATPKPPWPYTDDTAMAIDLVEMLLERGSVDVVALGRRFAARYTAEPGRGYGPAMHDQLRRVLDGESPLAVAPSMFGGSGSFGNGSAMRVAPLGAYFATAAADGDNARLVDEATKSSLATHTHPEAVAGAVAVALTTALLCSEADVCFDALVARVAEHVAPSVVRDGLDAARSLGRDASVARAAQQLGTGARVSAQDTVPFCVWVAASEPDDFERALWKTVSGLGDRDTTCAIVGGMLGARLGSDAIPRSWRDAAEAHGVQ